MKTARAALFLDFDNFFSGLMDADPTLALDIVKSPSRWLQSLAHRTVNDVERQWLVLRCYMNPGGSIPNPANPGERLYFSKFRPFFTQAGVEVVDCPALTKGSKNGADIRIVIDVMTAMRANTRYDEFVIASADADFTPLLQVLRADDRRITVIATSATATAYESLADRFLDEQDIFDLVVDETELLLEAEPPRITEKASSVSSEALDRSLDPQYQTFGKVVRSAFADAEEPINLARLSSALKPTSEADARYGPWYGEGSFRRAIEGLELPNVRFTQHVMWDTTRHQDPSPAGWSSRSDLPPSVVNFKEVTGMPNIPSAQWPVIYEALEAYAANHSYNFTEASRWSRDHASGKGFEIPRRAFTFTIQACQNEGSARLNAKPSPSAAAISRALYNALLWRAEQAGLEASEAEKQELATWLHLAETLN